MHVAKHLMRMGKPKRSYSRGAALIAIGAAVGAGMAMMRGNKTEHRQASDGEGPVESDF